MSADPNKPEPKIVDCPACGGTITLRALGQSVMAACPSCGTQIDVSRPEIRIIKQYRLQQQQLRIPLGTRGSLRGQAFEVIGALRRGDSHGHWEEYLLFNPFLGFRWLVHDSGHWSLGQMLKDTSKVSKGVNVRYNGNSYRKYMHARPQIRWVVGEFYWRVKVGDQVDATDYVAPPFMLSCEKDSGEVTWTLLEYLEPRAVETAFHITSPRREWLAANQPNPAGQAWHAIKRVMLLALVAALVVQIGTALRAQDKMMYLGTYDLASTAGEPQTYGPFTLTTAVSLNELTASAPINNSWVELQCSLVNTVTGQSFDFTNGFSFYSGIDSDGGWSEGSSHQTTDLPTIPAGTYKLVVAGAGGDDSGKQPLVRVSLSLQHDVAPWRNFWLAVLVILIYPGYLFFRSAAYEKERWSDAEPA